MPGGCPNFVNFLNDDYSLPNALLREWHDACIAGNLKSTRLGSSDLAPTLMRAFWVADFTSWCTEEYSIDMFDAMELLGHHSAEVQKLKGYYQLDLSTGRRPTQKRGRGVLEELSESESDAESSGSESSQSIPRRRSNRRRFG